MKKILMAVVGLAVLTIGATVAQGSTRTPEKIPVDELTRQLDAFEAELVDQQTAIAACMAARGFEYIPHLPADWVMERAAELDHAGGGSGDVDVEPPDDPNDAILVRMTPGQLDAYQAAYWGDATAPGCYDITYEQVFGVNRPEEFERLATVADRVDAAMATDQRMIDARARYSECMRGFGLSVAGPDDLYRNVDERRHLLETAADEQEVALDKVAGYSEYVAFEQAASDAHELCITDYHTVEDPVRAEYVDHYLNQP